LSAMAATSIRQKKHPSSENCIYFSGGLLRDFRSFDHHLVKQGDYK